MTTVDVDRVTFEGGSFSRAAFVRVWMLALATYGVGDVVTTVALVWFSPFHVEANPVVGASIAAFGGGGFLALKLLVFYACIGIAVWGGVLDDDPLLFYLPPVVLTIVGVTTTVTNLHLLA